MLTAQQTSKIWCREVNCEGGIVIPDNFSQSVMTGQQGTIIIVSDESNPQISATIQGALNRRIRCNGNSS